MFSIVMLSVVMLCVVMLGVVVPYQSLIVLTAFALSEKLISAEVQL